jgi:hypothetical protein
VTPWRGVRRYRKPRTQLKAAQIGGFLDLVRCKLSRSATPSPQVAAFGECFRKPCAQPEAGPTYAACPCVVADVLSLATKGSCHFSCMRRGCCPSCLGRRMSDTARGSQSKEQAHRCRRQPSPHRRRPPRLAHRKCGGVVRRRASATITARSETRRNRAPRGGRRENSERGR